MGTENSFDVKIAVFFKRALNYYVKKRTYIKPPPTENEIWDELFKGKEVIDRELFNKKNINLYKDSNLCKLIYFGFEENEIAFLKKYLKPGDTFFDVGANIGLFSLNATDLIKPNGKIFAFEPTPETFKRLESNISLNHIENIKPINIGISDHEGKLNFNISNSGYDAWNSFAKIDKLENGSSIEVNVKSLDQFIRENAVDLPSLIKIDVEGWEKFVILGAQHLLNQSNAPVLMIEFTETNAFAAGYYCGELFDLIKSYGYELYSYDQISNKLKKEIKKLHYPWENLIAIKDYENCYNRINKA